MLMRPGSGHPSRTSTSSRPRLVLRVVAVLLGIAALLSVSTGSAQAAVTYKHLDGKATVFGDQNAVWKVATDGVCQYQFKYIVAGTGSYEGTVLGQLVRGTKCDVFLTAHLYNWDTDTFQDLNVVSKFGVSGSKADGYNQFGLGDVQARKGWALMYVDAAVSDYVGSVSQGGRSSLYDLRMCSPSKYQRWDCGSAAAW